MTANTLSWYMSRVIEIPPLTAQAAFDRTAATEPVVATAAGTARLLLSGDVGTPAAALGVPLRTTAGLLRSRRRRLRVDLELWPWSHDRVQIGLFPYGTVLRPHPSNAVIEAGHALLAELDRMLWVATHAPDVVAAAASAAPNRAASRRRREVPVLGG